MKVDVAPSDGAAMIPLGRHDTAQVAGTPLAGVETESCVLLLVEKERASAVRERLAAPRGVN